MLRGFAQKLGVLFTVTYCGDIGKTDLVWLVPRHSSRFFQIESTVRHLPNQVCFFTCVASLLHFRSLLLMLLGMCLLLPEDCRVIYCHM